MVLFLLGLGFTMDGLYGIVDEAMQYPIVTSTQLATRTSVTFPAITICNINRINCFNAVKHVRKLERLGTAEAAAEAKDLREMTDYSGCTSQVCYHLGVNLENVVARYEKEDYTDRVPFVMLELGCQHYEDVAVIAFSSIVFFLVLSNFLK